MSSTSDFAFMELLSGLLSDAFYASTLWVVYDEPVLRGKVKEIRKTVNLTNLFLLFRVKKKEFMFKYV